MHSAQERGRVQTASVPVPTTQSLSSAAIADSEHAHLIAVLHNEQD